MKDVGAENVKWIKADLRNYSQASAAIKSAETVYHLVAVVGSLEAALAGNRFAPG